MKELDHEYYNKFLLLCYVSIEMCRIYYRKLKIQKDENTIFV